MEDGRRSDNQQSHLSFVIRWYLCFCSFSGLYTLVFVGTCVLGLGRGEGFESVGEDLQRAVGKT
jgi:hypothetical protein